MWDQGTIVDTASPLITVAGELGVESTDSTLLIRPSSMEAYQLVAEGATLTIADAGSITEDVNQLNVQSGTLLLQAEAEVAENSLTVTLTPVDADSLLAGLSEKGLSKAQSAVVEQARDAALSIIPRDLAKARKIFETLNNVGDDIKPLAGSIQPDLTGSVQKSGQALVSDAQGSVFNRVYGKRRGVSYRGLNYGDQFSSDNVWGQFVYNSGSQQVMGDEPGFRHRTLGFSLGY